MAGEPTASSQEENNMADIVLKDVSKAYGAVQVLDKVNMHIRSGEFIVFLGPSGCGKSTLLRMIAGLEAVNDGEIHIGERRVDNLPPNQRGVAMVFQNYALYPHMTVRQNMSFGLENIGTEKAEIARRVEDAARMLEIGALLDRRPAQLSGGQRQRVAIGRAIVREPQAFLLDEPLSNLDAGLRVRTRVELAQLHQRIGTRRPRGTDIEPRCRESTGGPGVAGIAEPEGVIGREETAIAVQTRVAGG